MLTFDKTVDDLIECLKQTTNEGSGEKIVIWARLDGGKPYLYHSCVHQDGNRSVLTLCRNSEGDEWSWKADSVEELQATLEGDLIHIYDASINDIIFQTLTGE